MSITRRKFVSLFASMALTLSLVGIAPAAAYADDATTGGIDASATAITVTTGSSTDLSQYFKADKTVNGDYHFDYVLSGSGATVNKHNGTFIGTTAGDYTVTVYLLAGAQPDKNSGKPCSGFTILKQTTLKVTVAGSDTTYGYQGSGKNSILVTDPAVTKVSHSATADTYTNTLSAPTLGSDGYYRVTYKQNAGFKSYDSAQAYENLNKSNITLLDTETGEVIASLADGSGILTVESATHSSKTIVLKIKADEITLGDTTLQFENGLRGNSETVLLGSTVQFEF